MARFCSFAWYQTARLAVASEPGRNPRSAMVPSEKSSLWRTGTEVGAPAHTSTLTPDTRRPGGRRRGVRAYRLVGGADYPRRSAEGLTNASSLVAIGCLPCSVAILPTVPDAPRNAVKATAKTPLRSEGPPRELKAGKQPFAMPDASTSVRWPTERKSTWREHGCRRALRKSVQEMQSCQSPSSPKPVAM